MTEAIQSWLLTMIGVAFVTAIASFFASGSSMKRVLKLIGGVAMAAALLSPLLKFDFAAYAASLQLYNNSVAWDSATVEETENRLNRTIIESECSAYILDKAAQLGVSLTGAQVSVQWSTTDGIWYPYAVTLTQPVGAEKSAALTDNIEADLGIPSERQEWREDAQQDE